MIMLLHPKNINRKERFKLSHSWNPAIKILQTTDTDIFNNIRRGVSSEMAGYNNDRQSLVNRQIIMLQVKKQGTEPRVGIVTGRSAHQ
jgi:hypothetical protein